MAHRYVGKPVGWASHKAAFVCPQCETTRLPSLAPRANSETESCGSTTWWSLALPCVPAEELPFSGCLGKASCFCRVVANLALT